MKFTERGEIRVAARPGPGDTVVFSVTDTGIGIAAEDLPRIFEEFGQIENPLQARSKGTGLGLPLSRKLAELLGGSVCGPERARRRFDVLRDDPAGLPHADGGRVGHRPTPTPRDRRTRAARRPDPGP